HYGQLDRVLVCNRPTTAPLCALSGQTRLLAVISPCQSTHGKDAALELMTHRGMGPAVVVDLQCVVAVVGRLQTRGSWNLVDRTGGLIWPEFFGDDDDAGGN
ncbi:hypothetical protein B0H16DRAFT_1857874, partial [Mycena metata]